MTHFLIKKPIFLFNVEAIRGPVCAASEKSEVLKMFFSVSRKFGLGTKGTNLPKELHSVTIWLDYLINIWPVKNDNLPNGLQKLPMFICKKS